jgi:hypothetical protein
LILAEDDPDAAADTALPAGCTWDLPYLISTYTSSASMSFDAMLSAIEGHFAKQVPSSTPVWVQAWSGRGGNGGVGDLNAGSGTQGYATTISSAGTLQGKTLYL